MFVGRKNERMGLVWFPKHTFWSQRSVNVPSESTQFLKTLDQVIKTVPYGNCYLFPNRSSIGNIPTFVEVRLAKVHCKIFTITCSILLRCKKSCMMLKNENYLYCVAISKKWKSLQAKRSVNPLLFATVRWQTLCIVWIAVYNRML